MKHYAIAELTVTDPSWTESYVRDVTQLVERCGGRYLARTARIERLEGERKLPQILVLVEWPSREAAQEFYDSEEYRPHRAARVNGAINELILVRGEDMTGASHLRTEEA